MASQQCTQTLLAAGGNEGRKAPFEASLQIELFARVPKTRMNTSLQELWHERERERERERGRERAREGGLCIFFLRSLAREFKRKVQNQSSFPKRKRLYEKLLMDLRTLLVQ